MSKRISLSNMTIPEALRALADEYDALWTEYEGSYSGSYKGAYNPEVQYSLYDRVHLIIGNLVYLAKVKNVGEAGFIVGIPPNEPDSLYWEVITVNFLIRGEQGLQGVKGEQGDKGLPGTSFYVSSQVGLTELSTLIERNSITYAGREVRNGDIIVSTDGLPFTVIDYNFSSEYHKVAYVENASFRGMQGEPGAVSTSTSFPVDWKNFDYNMFNGVFGVGWQLIPREYYCRGITANDTSGKLSTAGFSGNYAIHITITDPNYGTVILSKPGIKDIFYFGVELATAPKDFSTLMVSVVGVKGEKGQDSVVQVYKHQIQYAIDIEGEAEVFSYIDILNRSSVPFTLATFKNYLSANHTSVSSLLPCSGFEHVTAYTQRTIVGVYMNGSQIAFYKPDKTSIIVDGNSPYVFDDIPILI